MSDRAVPTRREALRVETDRKIYEAALRLVATAGTDGLSLPAIAKEAGLSTGPVYARFGGVDDVIVVLWDLFLHDELVRIITLQLSWVNGAGPMINDLRELYEAPGELVSALVEVMATVRRYPFAVEVLEPQINEIFQAAAMPHPAMPESIFKLQIGYLLGFVFAKSVFPRALQDNCFLGLEMMREMATTRHAWDARGVGEEIVPVLLPEVHDESPVRESFMRGALQTIAVTGVDGASAQRIARAAGYGFSAAYTYFRSRDELAEEALMMVIGQIFSLNMKGYLVVDHQEFVSTVAAVQRGSLSESGRLMRQLRVESIVAARHSKRLSRCARDAFTESIERAAKMGTTSPEGTYSRLAAWTIIATHAFAVPLISGCSHYRDDIDWAPVSEQLFFVRERFRA